MSATSGLSEAEWHATRARHIGSKTPIVCAHCGVHALADSSAIKRGMGRFCSIQCAGRAKRLPISKRGASRKWVRNNGPKTLEWLFAQSIPEPNSGCWIWLRSSNPDGYGQTQFEGRLVQSHVVACKLIGMKIPQGWEIDHRCRVRLCCNPQHLEPVTRSENIKRAHMAKTKEERLRSRTHCEHGHEFTDQNTWTDKFGWRHCRECRKFHARQFRARRNSAS